MIHRLQYKNWSASLRPLAKCRDCDLYACACASRHDFDGLVSLRTSFIVVLLREDTVLRELFTLLWLVGLWSLRRLLRLALDRLLQVLLVSSFSCCSVASEVSFDFVSTFSFVSSCSLVDDFFSLSLAWVSECWGVFFKTFFKSISRSKGWTPIK